MKVGFVAEYSEESFKIAAQAGLDCVELCPPESWFGYGEESRKEVEKAKALSRQYGISIVSLAISREIGGVNLRASVEEREKQLQRMALRIDVCKALGDDVVYCFTGPQGYDARKSLKENVAVYKEVYAPVAELAAKKRVRVAFENCPGIYPFADGCTLAITPEAWELMFEALPSDYLGLEFDPSHLIWQFIDEIAAAKAFKHKIFIVHAKDTKVIPERLAKMGTHGGYKWVHWHGYTWREQHEQGWWVDRHPGYGDTNWPQLMMIMHEVGFDGALVIEHLDPVFGKARRVEGLCIAANYLRKCMVT